MLRLLVTPRWLAATLFVLIAFPLCIRLGVWQWDRAHRPPKVLTASEERPVPLSDLLDGRPADLVFPVGQLVRATGHYESTQLVLDGVNASGATEPWAVSPMAADGASAPIAVVRGLAKPAPSAPTSGDVVVTGRIEPPAASSASGSSRTLDAAELRAQGVDPRGYLVVTAQQPADTKPPVLAQATPPPPSSGGLRWQNSTYAAQWWLFGLFFLVAWLRFFREDLKEARGAPADVAAPA